MIILTKQHAQTSNYHYSRSLVDSLLDQQNPQFSNVKEGKFRSLKDCDKQICNCDDNDLLLLKRCRQNYDYFTTYMLKHVEHCAKLNIQKIT